MSSKPERARRRKAERRDYSGWRCVIWPDSCHVFGYIVARGCWDTVAKIAVRREASADLMKLVMLLNGRQCRAGVLAAIEVLEALEEFGLTSKTEIELEALLERLKREYYERLELA